MPQNDILDDSFLFYGKQSSGDKFQKKEKGAENFSSDQNKRDSDILENKMKNKSKKSRRDSEVDEIPATPSPPRLNNQSFTSLKPSGGQDNKLMSAIPSGRYEIKALTKIKKQDRPRFNSSMISSPSIANKNSPVSDKTSASVSRSPINVKQSNPEPMDVEMLFETLKKQGNCVQNLEETKKTSEVQSEVTSTPKKLAQEDSKQDSSYEETKSNTSSSSKQELANLKPIVKFQPNPNWSNLNPDVLRYSKETSANFGIVTNELKIAYEKILDFRRALGPKLNKAMQPMQFE